MRCRAVEFGWAWFVSLGCLPVLGQVAERLVASSREAEVDEPSLVLAVGTATSWDVDGGAAIFAPTLAAEVTPIENWLKLEAGVTPFYTRDTREWDADFLFKKPWSLSPSAEFMVGAGPQWVNVRQDRKTSNTVSGEVVANFILWPKGNRHVGYYVQPGYAYSFAGDHPQSVGMSAGLVFGMRPGRARVE